VELPIRDRVGGEVFAERPRRVDSSIGVETATDRHVPTETCTVVFMHKRRVFTSTVTTLTPSRDGYVMHTHTHIQIHGAFHTQNACFVLVV